MSASLLQRSLLSALRRFTARVPIRIEVGPESGHVAAAQNSSHASATLRLADTRALVALLCNPQMNFGDLYSKGRLEVEGNLVGLLEDFYWLPDTRSGRIAGAVLGLWQPNTLRGSRRNIRRHYDLPTEFHAIYLDPQLVYTCAYFPSETTTLEDAQIAKMDHVARKLWLRPGETVVEAGCGWGSLALHMARHYGVKVKAFNISSEQIAYARERLRKEGLGARVEFIQDDYRNISGRFDAFVSVGMLEHVGRRHYGELGSVIRRAIGDSGRGLLHFIGRNKPRPLNPWIRRRIFPGAYPPVLREAMEVLEPQDFTVLDVENIGRHYARTLECWLQNFDQAFDRVTREYGVELARKWRLYLAGSTAAFRMGGMHLFQVVFAGRECASVPWTRAYLYDRAEQESSQWNPVTS
jgi:cyclopropane-fatty-acyl-phospholipid synthase